MTCFAPFTVLRQQIREAKDKGELVPSTEAIRKQFEALVINEVSPMLKHVASILCQDGIPASAAIELDHQPAYAELRLMEAGVQLFIVDMSDGANIRVDLHLKGETTPTQTTFIPISGQVKERLSFLLEELLIHTLVPPQHCPPATPQGVAAMGHQSN